MHLGLGERGQERLLVPDPGAARSDARCIELRAQYFTGADGSVESVPFTFASIYVRPRKSLARLRAQYLHPKDGPPIEPFPANLRMLVGDPAGSTFDPALNISCLNFAGGTFETYDVRSCRRRTR